MSARQKKSNPAYYISKVYLFNRRCQATARLFLLYRGLVVQGLAGSAIKRIADEAILSDFAKIYFGRMLFMNYADIKRIDVANGPGIRVSLFVSGCTHHCKGCFNEETWDFNYGQFFSEKEEDQIIEYLKEDYIEGLSLLGGEPFEYSNQQCLLPFLRRVKAIYPDKDIWCYTGYDFETDIKEKMMVKWPETREIIRYIDILVDGEFIEDKKDLTLRFRGSSNQRIIDVPESLNKGEVVLWNQEGRITQ